MHIFFFFTLIRYIFFIMLILKKSYDCILFLNKHFRKKSKHASSRKTLKSQKLELGRNLAEYSLEIKSLHVYINFLLFRLIYLVANSVYLSVCLCVCLSLSSLSLSCIKFQTIKFACYGNCITL